ncbi:MAG: molecular chaperone DnaJ [Acidimicrobiia bacterium]
MAQQQPQREWFEKDYYKILGVPETASQREIKAAYRRLSKQYHPDRNPGAEDRFKEISAAYDVLGDPEKRKAYDEVRRMGPVGGFGPGPAGGGGFSFRIDDLGDLFGGLFGRGRRGFGGGAAGPRRGEDLEAELHLSFDEAVNGSLVTVNVMSDAPCGACNGTGAAPGTTPVVCPRCGGRGVLDENQGLFSFSTPCTRCAGRGMVVERPCATCRGTGVVRVPRKVRVKVPAGVADGQRIRLKGKGGAGRNGGPPGDLYVRVHVAPHPLFGRRGDDLTITVPITFAEAALGAEVKVPTLTGPVTLRIPPGTRSGQTFRVRGRGVRRENGTAGDLLVTVEVAVPQTLSPAERRAIEELAAATTTSPRAHLGV